MHNCFEIAGFPSAAAANLVTSDVFWRHNDQVTDVTDQDLSFDIFSSDEEVSEGMLIKSYLVDVTLLSKIISHKNLV